LNLFFLELYALEREHFNKFQHNGVEAHAPIDDIVGQQKDVNEDQLDEIDGVEKVIDTEMDELAEKGVGNALQDLANSDFANYCLAYGCPLNTDPGMIDRNSHERLMRPSNPANDAD
jgi:hypothetical protein